MASQRRILRTEGTVALVEEKIFMFAPVLTIHTSYSVTSGRHPSDSIFDTLSAAQRYFTDEVERCRPSRS